jgi:hypothetical protein
MKSTAVREFKKKPEKFRKAALDLVLTAGRSKAANNASVHHLLEHSCGKRLLSLAYFE